MDIVLVDLLGFDQLIFTRLQVEEVLIIVVEDMVESLTVLNVLLRLVNVILLPWMVDLKFPGLVIIEELILLNIVEYFLERIRS